MAPAHGPFPMAAVLVSKEDSTPSPLVLWAEQRSVPHCVDLWVHLPHLWFPSIPAISLKVEVDLSVKP